MRDTCVSSSNKSCKFFPTPTTATTTTTTATATTATAIATSTYSYKSIATKLTLVDDMSCVILHMAVYIMYINIDYTFRMDCRFNLSASLSFFGSLFVAYVYLSLITVVWEKIICLGLVAFFIVLHYCTGPLIVAKTTTMAVPSNRVYRSLFLSCVSHKQLQQQQVL